MPSSSATSFSTLAMSSSPVMTAVIASRLQSTRTVNSSTVSHLPCCDTPFEWFFALGTLACQVLIRRSRSFLDAGVRDRHTPAVPLPSTHRAAVYTEPGQVVVDERPVPPLGPHDVLLEVSHCGVCGSDIHFVLEGWGRPGSVEGHEWSGTVVAVGDAVTAWSVGDGVVGGPSPRCGTCQYCLAGRPSLCTGRSAAGVDVHPDGAFAEYVVSSERGILRVPDGVSLRHAALAEPLAVALHGLTRGGVT